MAKVNCWGINSEYLSDIDNAIAISRFKGIQCGVDYAEGFRMANDAYRVIPYRGPSLRGYKMETYIKEYSLSGKTLFAKNDFITIGIPLNYGLRISYLSYNGSDNLFFEQPKDMTDLTTPEGWRIYGGHRLWVAPEGDETYYPDNEPISYEILEDKIIIRQKNDPWLMLEKSMQISFLSDDSLQIIHQIKNTDDKTRRCALWPVTSVAPGGTQIIPLKYSESGYKPLHQISTWFYTNLGDERATYERDSIMLKHKPTSQRYKIGVGHPVCPVTYKNKGVVFEKSFEIFPEMEYTDGNVSYETFMCDHMVELESLSPLYDIAPGESAKHTEIWKLKK